jgi:hypothetical protein
MENKDTLFVNGVWAHEADLLGLGEHEIIIPTEQVKVVIGLDKSGTGRILINVHDIEITHMDHVSQQVNYRIVGLNQLVQNWDLGGAYLAPKSMEAGTIDGEYA